MNKWLLLLLYLVCIESAFSALSPQYQNMRDLEALSHFIEKHPKVSSQLEHIDLNLFLILYGDGCVAKFKRKKIIHLLGWVGPASPLIFLSSTC